MFQIYLQLSGSLSVLKCFQVKTFAQNLPCFSWLRTTLALYGLVSRKFATIIAKSLATKTTWYYPCASLPYSAIQKIRETLNAHLEKCSTMWDMTPSRPIFWLAFVLPGLITLIFHSSIQLCLQHRSMNLRTHQIQRFYIEFSRLSSSYQTNRIILLAEKGRQNIQARTPSRCLNIRSNIFCLIGKSIF